MFLRSGFSAPCAAVAALILLVACGETKTHDSSGEPSAAVGDTTSFQLVNCCIKPSCEVCVEKFGRCTCLEDLKAGKAICGECIHGYKEGKGKLKLISIPELKKRPGT